MGGQSCKVSALYRKQLRSNLDKTVWWMVAPPHSVGEGQIVQQMRILDIVNVTSGQARIWCSLF